MAEPYLSIVVTARNDDHGGNLLGRMQAFVNGWMNQARAHQLDSELIIVEWNPPAGRPRLAEALRWPEEPGPCAVRIIEVPPELHARYAHGAALPLYQMIGKNVGIRRARGQFVLATNIDILFSSELIRLFAERRLDPGRMYRIDRHDVMSDVPVDSSPEEQQAYCDAHVIRINRREGTFPADFDPRTAPTAGGGKAVAGDKPAASPRQPEPATFSPFCAGLRADAGWFPPERHSAGEIFCWAQPKAELLVTDAPKSGAVLTLDVEPGPGTGDEPIDFAVTVDDRPVARFAVGRRSILRIRADWAAGRRVGFETSNPIAPLARDPRALAFRVLGSHWQRSLRSPSAPSASLRPFPLTRRARALWRAVNLLIARMEADAPVATVSVLVSPALRRLLRRYLALVSVPPLDRPKEAAPPNPKQEIPPPAMLHTNACGDFTLAAREHWIDLRGYAEFDLYSMNLDSLFCYAAHHAGVREEMLKEPARIYHIEHGSGSGWTPEGQQKLYARLAAAGLSFLEMDTVLAWGAHMQHLESPMIFNRENWGLGEFELSETTPLDSRR